MSFLRGQTLTLEFEGSTETISWKQGSILGFGGDQSQDYVLCKYKLSGGAGAAIPVYIQVGYDIKKSMIIDSSLQYGMQNDIDIIFFVYHDQSQRPHQYRFMSTNLEKFALAANEVLKMYGKGIDLSWIAGEYLNDI